MRPRRALWVCDYFPRPHDPAAGTWALGSIVALQERGLETVVLAPTPWIPRAAALSAELRAWATTPSRWRIRGVDVHYARCPHYPRRWVHDTVYTRLPVLDTALLWPWCAPAAHRIMTSQPFDVVHANFIFPSGYLGLKLKERYGVPLVVEEWSVQRLAAASATPARRRAYARVLSAADAVVTLNDRMAARLLELAPQIRELRVMRAHGADPERARLCVRPRPEPYRDRRVILSAGALSERKGHEYLIRAVATLRREFPDLACIIMGDGPRRAELQSLIGELGLERTVLLAGRVPNDDVLGAMSWCDVFALTSWGEAIGTVYGEAMQFGVPIVACAGEGIAELVEDGVHGLLVPPRDVDATARALRRLLAHPEQRAAMGERARELAAAELSYSRLANDLLRLYCELGSAELRQPHGAHAQSSQMPGAVS